MLAQALIELLNQPRGRFSSVGLSSLIKRRTNIEKHQQSEVMLMEAHQCSMSMTVISKSLNSPSFK